MVVARVANSETFTVTTPSDVEIRMTRLFDAPRRLVFEAMTRPEHVRRWWGILDDGYSVPVCEIDLRPGGKWRFVGRTPEGDIPAFYGEFREIVPPERIVQTECFEPFPDAPAVNTRAATRRRFKIMASGSPTTATSAWSSIRCSSARSPACITAPTAGRGPMPRPGARPTPRR